MTAGFLISAPRSGSGKTVLTLGLMRALARRGLRIAGAKNGPDYIDPAFHAAATGRDSLNLDTWAMAPKLVSVLAATAATDCDLLICEGSMGLFDGVAAPHRCSGSSADLAATLGLPVLLVLDVSGQSQTAAAVALGCARLDPGVSIAGVILNRIGSDRHRRLVTDAIEAIGLKVLGALPRTETLVLPERHLGLVQAQETTGLSTLLDTIADFVTAHVDLDAVLAMAQPFAPASGVAACVRPPGQSIAIARDAAFSFLYPHVLRGWRAAGAAVSYFSPLADEGPTEDADVCWLPGGYPELHAGRLAQAARFKLALAAFSKTRPIHGECGGYMALGETLTDADGVVHPMVGLLGASFSFAKRKMNLGYRNVTLEADCSLGRKGARFRGHEFHYATTTTGVVPDLPFASAADAQGNPPQPAGSRRERVTGSFFHVVAPSD